MLCFSVVYDASDIVLGDDEKADFDRCVDEVAHIRRCLQLSTQSSKRRNRYPTSGGGGGAESKTPTSLDDHSKQISTDFDSTLSDEDHDSDSDS